MPQNYSRLFPWIQIGASLSQSWYCYLSPMPFHAGMNLGYCGQAPHWFLCILIVWSKPTFPSATQLLGRTQLEIALLQGKSSFSVPSKIFLTVSFSSLVVNLVQTKLRFQEQLMSLTHSHVCIYIYKIYTYTRACVCISSLSIWK